MCRNKSLIQNPELKPCPFCGSENLTLKEIGGMYNLAIECEDCLACGSIKKDLDKGETAIAAWNRRV